YRHNVDDVNGEFLPHLSAGDSFAQSVECFLKLFPKNLSIAKAIFHAFDKFCNHILLIKGKSSILVIEGLKKYDIRISLRRT
ncbi:MAG: hypothetical protein KAI34_08020, partial [Candidatus Lokiarchaeota archaeon]|nr:hypothetical protein [Candidatus Lokiarchaeota archaeon]